MAEAKTTQIFGDRATDHTVVVLDDTGELALVCLGCEGGYILYSPDEWQGESAADHEADSAGNITFQGQATGQILPQAAMDNAVD